MTASLAADVPLVRLQCRSIGGAGRVCGECSWNHRLDARHQDGRAACLSRAGERETGTHGASDSESHHSNVREERSMAIGARKFQSNGVEPATRLETAGHVILRYGLVLVVAWIGAMKFTGYEAAGIQPLVANSPFMGWMYRFLSVQGFSNLLGTVEIAVAAMIAVRPLSARVAAVGSAMAVMMFLTTLTFLCSTPGWEPSLGGFPALSVVPGQFLLKDVVLLGTAVWSLGEALNAIRP